jgi:hypothetical protein
MKGLVGTVMYTKKMRDGSLLVHCANKKQAKKLLEIKSFCSFAVSVDGHPSLNVCNGVISCFDLLNSSAPVWARGRIWPRAFPLPIVKGENEAVEVGYLFKVTGGRKEGSRAHLLVTLISSSRPFHYFFSYFHRSLPHMCRPSLRPKRPPSPPLSVSDCLPVDDPGYVSWL